MLIKFFRPEHVQQFLDGMLYFKNAGYFIDEEEKRGNKGIGDKHEGSFFSPFNPQTHEIYISIGDGEEKHKLNITRGFSTSRYENVRQLQLTCFTAITLDDMENINVSEQKIKDELIEELKKDFEGRVPVLISDENTFFDKVKDAFETADIGAKRGFVNYFDGYKGYPLTEEEYENDITKAFFYKKDYFKSQREYRIITSHPVEGDSLELHLGDIKECVVNLESVDNLKNLMLQTIEKEEVGL
ncbi:hypothetical protein [Bacillus mobilis]